MSPLQWQIFARLLAAFFFGGLIGLERETHGRPAGLRTHILVGLGSALIMVVSIYGLQGLGAAYDPGRIAAQVVSGIGFLGAGTILREGLSIRGLTTAASLWMVAGIGLAAGSGLIVVAGIATLIALVVLYFLHPLENRFEMGGHLYEFEVNVRTSVAQVPEVMKLVRKYHGKLTLVEVGKEGSLLRLSLKVPTYKMVEQVFKDIAGLNVEAE
ncbi:MAG: MgtC/SapB family protein [Firmicutes bacterium]|nr:MgtC/SapB family protein [Bacillota bacterium]